MVVDSGAEVNLVCLAQKHFMKHVTKLHVPLQLETAGGDLILDTIGDLLCGGTVCHGCVFNPLLTVSTARGEKDGSFFGRCPEGYGLLKGTNGNVELERSGGLDCLVGGERSAFPALLTPGSVDMEGIVEQTTWTSSICAEATWNLIQGARRARP